MLILRRITSEGFESNTVVGNEYDIITEVQHTEKFIETKDLLQIDNSEGKIFGFIIYKKGSEISPLYKKSSYYMMTESGSTFANLSFK